MTQRLTGAGGALYHTQIKDTAQRNALFCSNIGAMDFLPYPADE